MKIPYTFMPRIRAVTVLAFVVACAVFFGYLWMNMGGVIPGVSKSGYRVSFEISDVDNLVYDSDVMVAGVRVGKVRELEEENGTAKVVVQLDDESVHPLHEGATVQVRSKSLIEETYLEFTDGTGDEIPNGGSLPPKAVEVGVQLDDVLKTLDKKTRRSLGKSLRSVGTATHMTKEDLSRVMSGLGALGREGHDVLGALSAQSQDLKAMVRSTSKLVRAVDTGHGRVVDLVDEADQLAGVTADHRKQVRSTVRQLPAVLDHAENATGSLTRLARDLTPVTHDLATASPALNRALVQLPAVTKDLRGLLPSLDASLDRLPGTLEPLPGVAKDVSDLVPSLRVDLADLNPMLAFLKPYGGDLANFFTTWTAMLSQRDANGHYLRIFPVLNEQSLKGVPVPLNHGFLDKSNAYPKPGEATDPGPFEGKYPHVERDPR